MEPAKEQRRSLASTTLLIWGVLTILVLASLLGIWLWRGPVGFETAIQRGPYTNLQTALTSVAITWLLAGFFIFLLSSGRIHSKNAFTYAGFFLVALVYLNLLRERTEYGDVEYYINAALKLSAGQALPNEYFYPPLWATLLAWMAPLGENGIFLTVWLLNLLSLFAFYFLLVHTLHLYGFSARFAALITTGFMLANAPILRTMVYMQVNSARDERGLAQPVAVSPFPGLFCADDGSRCASQSLPGRAGAGFPARMELALAGLGSAILFGRGSYPAGGARPWPIS